MNRLITAICAQVILICISSSAKAAVTVVLEEVGGDVVATASGSLDTSGFGAPAGTTAAALLFYGAPDQWVYEIGAGSAFSYTAPFSPAQTLHTMPFPVTAADTDSGGPVGVLDSPSFPAGPRLSVPSGYVSGSPINATATWTGATFASLQLTVGTYVFDYGADSLTFIVQASGVGPGTAITAPVPVPDLPLVGLAVLIVGIVVAARMRLSRSNRH